MTESQSEPSTSTTDQRTRPEQDQAAASDQGSGQPRPDSRQQGQGERVVVVTEGGMGVADKGDKGDKDDDDSAYESRGPNPTDMVEQPAKVMRMGSMIKQLLEEVRNSPLDEAGRSRLAEIHRRSVTELKEGLSPELAEELERITLPFTEQAPSDAELRIAQAQLVGWLEGLFHGIQTALVAQQMAAQAQLQEMRRALPPGAQAQQMAGPDMPGMPGGPRGDDAGPTGQYL